MDQSVQFPKRRRIKVNPINEINKEATIDTYKSFFIDNLQNIKNRSKALNDLEMLRKKYQELEGSSSIVSAFRIHSVAEDLVREHFSSSVYIEFTKEISIEYKPYKDPTSNFVGIFLHTINYETEKSKQKILYRSKYLNQVYSCLKDFGLHKFIFERNSDEYKRYNVIVDFNQNYNIPNTENKMLMSFENLNNNFLVPYKKKLPIQINGKLIKFEKITRLQISSTLLLDDEIPLLGLQKGFGWSNDHKNMDGFTLASFDETDELISNPYVHGDSNYHGISEECIADLLKLKNPDFNFNKLNKLVEELNVNISKKNYYSVAMITRAIIDHVPPLFKAKNFSEYVANLKKSSYKNMMERLDASSRDIANISLHKQIEKREIKLTPTQVIAITELETLLNEIVVEYK